MGALSICSLPSAYLSGSWQSVCVSPRPLLGHAHGAGLFPLTSVLLFRTARLALPDTPKLTPRVLGERVPLTAPACLSVATSQPWSPTVGACVQVASGSLCPFVF